MKRLMLLLLPVFAFAELGPELEYLAKTPVSRLEFALHNFQNNVDEWMETQQVIGGAWAEYAFGSIGLDAENNKIQFMISVHTSTDGAKDCSAAIAAARARFATKLFGNPLVTFFGHHFMDPPPPTDDMARAVGKRVEITCTAGGTFTKAYLISEDDE